MKKVELLPLAEVMVGMRVAEAIVDDGGRILVPVGADVSEGMLLSLRRREVLEVTVEHEVEEDPQAYQAYRARLVAQLDLVFRKAGDDEPTRQLYAAVLAHRLEHRA